MGIYSLFYVASAQFNSSIIAVDLPFYGALGIKSWSFLIFKANWMRASNNAFIAMLDIFFRGVAPACYQTPAFAIDVSESVC